MVSDIARGDEPFSTACISLIQSGLLEVLEHLRPETGTAASAPTNRIVPWAFDRRSTRKPEDELLAGVLLVNVD